MWRSSDGSLSGLPSSVTSASPLFLCLLCSFAGILSTLLRTVQYSVACGYCPGGCCNLPMRKIKMVDNQQHEQGWPWRIVLTSLWFYIYLRMLQVFASQHKQCQITSWSRHICRQIPMLVVLSTSPRTVAPSQVGRAPSPPSLPGALEDAIRPRGQPGPVRDGNPSSFGPSSRNKLPVQLAAVGVDAGTYDAAGSRLKQVGRCHVLLCTCLPCLPGKQLQTPAYRNI